MESSICVPNVLGSIAIVTPVPKRPDDDAPTHPDKITKNIKLIKYLFFIF